MLPKVESKQGREDSFSSVAFHSAFDTVLICVSLRKKNKKNKEN